MLLMTPVLLERPVWIWRCLPSLVFSLKVFRFLSSVALDLNYPWKLAMRALKLAYFCIR